MAVRTVEANLQRPQSMYVTGTPLVEDERRQRTLIEIETVEHIACLRVAIRERWQIKALLYEFQDRGELVKSVGNEPGGHKLGQSTEVVAVVTL